MESQIHFSASANYTVIDHMTLLHFYHADSYYLAAILGCALSWDCQFLPFKHPPNIFTAPSLELNKVPPAC